MKSNCVKPDTFEHKLPTQAGVQLVRGITLNCAQCGEPQLNASPLCGRCRPPAAGRQQLNKAVALRKGTAGRHRAEISVISLDDLPRQSPAHKAIAMWDVDPEVAALMASQISDVIRERQGHTSRFWPNAEDTHVNYRGKTVGGII